MGLRIKKLDVLGVHRKNSNQNKQWKSLSWIPIKNLIMGKEKLFLIFLLKNFSSHFLKIGDSFIAVSCIMFDNFNKVFLTDLNYL